MPISPNITSVDTTEDMEEILSSEEVHSIKKRSVTGAISYFMKTALLQLFGLTTAFILSAFFEPENFGVYGYVTQIIGLLIFFSDVGLAASLVQKKKEPSLTDYRTAFTVQQLLSWAIVILVLIISQTGIVQNKVGQDGVWILLALAISFPLASLKTISSIKLERELKFSLLIVPQIVEQLIFDGILIYLAWNGVGVVAYAWAVAVRSVIGTIVMWSIKPWKIGIKFSKKSLKNLLGFGVKFQVNDFLARIKDQLYFLVLGQVLPLNQFGYIQWAKNWSMYPYNLTVQNVMAITFPTFSRLQQHKKLLQKALEKSIFFISLLIFPILGFMCLLITPLTVVVEQYNKWQPAILSFILFALSVGWAAISTPMVNTLNAIGKINKSLKLMVIWTSLTWIITPITLLVFGYDGVAIAAFIISFTSALSIIFVKRHLEVKVWPQVWRQLLGVTVMSIVGLLMMNFASQSISRMMFTAVAMGLSYLLIMITIGHNKLLSEINSLRN
ncbi:MAG: Undecaprenyl-diphospho-oligosaccharide flippase [Microgenomates bacterium 39_7]|nr:MAG: Undecaprenyl-diphospho-oligosaccharide flippase [Microgenomates bacterium 39_7]